ncbi:MAG: hypothetical protein F6K35_46975 [Okeania sp. SIO2H7]|nr:hypothetical protein [Okeania sp. SIO2H7]
MEWMGDRFGIPQTTLDRYHFWRTGQEKIWIADQACTALALSVGVALETIGIPFVRRTSRSFKPTTAGLQRFGTFAQRQTIALTADQTQRFMAGQQPLPFHCDKSVLIPGSTRSDNIQQGFIHVRYGPYELGCGRIKDNFLYSEIPKALRI